MLPYERFEAWKRCYELALRVYSATRAFPKDELYGLTSRARRAAFSVVANMAEGSAKRGSRGFRRFLDISLGSFSELSVIFRLPRDLEVLPAKNWQGLPRLRKHPGV